MKRVHPGLFQELVRNIREEMGKAWGGSLQGKQRVLQPTPACLPSEVGIPGLYWGTGQQDLVWDGHKLGFTQGTSTGGQ